MKPEEKARQRIDQLLNEAGWVVQDVQELNLGAALGVAIREFPLESGYADYLLFVEREAVGVAEAKPEGTTLSGVADQSGRYIASLPLITEGLPCFRVPVHCTFRHNVASFGPEPIPFPRSEPLLF